MRNEFNVNLERSQQKGMSDFRFRDWRGMGVFDVDKLGELSFREFRKLYVEEMQTYFDQWGDDSVRCSGCPDMIKGAEELFRYYGANLHLRCFEGALYKEDKKLKGRVTRIGGNARNYFNMVLQSKSQLELTLVD